MGSAKRVFLALIGIFVFSPAVGLAQIQTELFVQGLKDPVDFQVAPGDLRRVFIAERTGWIRTVSNGVLGSDPFLDLTAIVGSDRQGQGLLGFTFHPHFDTNRYFYVNYTDLGGNTVVARYTAAEDGRSGKIDSGKILLTIPQSPNAHHAGQLAFGLDGYLYISVADGGSEEEAVGNAQDRRNLLGKILRVDVDNGDPYSVPATNPFLNDPSTRHEIWAFGFRNPWRFSFDGETGDVYVADVGQNKAEEVNVVSATDPGGGNFGWNVMEGSGCFDPPADCDTSNLIPPAFEYSHQNGSCSVIGGYVYRGKAIPSLLDHYVFGDYCRGSVSSFRWANGMIEDFIDWTETIGMTVPFITSFGQDQEKEIYILSQSGDVYKLVPRTD